MTDPPDPQPAPTNPDGPPAPSPVRARRLPTAALWVLAAGLAVGAFCFGAPPRFEAAESASEPWRGFLESLGPHAIVQASMAAAFGLLIVTSCLRREVPGVPGGRAVRRATRPLVLLLALGVLQIVPLPTWLLGLVAPFSAETYAPLELAGESPWRSISLFPDGTQDALFTLVGVIAASVAVWTVIRDARAGPGGREAGLRIATCILAAILAVAFAESLYGSYEAVLGDDLILGMGKVSNPGDATGTFIHRTMLAVWAGMGLCAAIGLGARELLDDRPPRVYVLATLALCAGTCAVAALLTTSRLGFPAAIGGALVALVLVVAAMRAAGNRKSAGLLAAATALLPVLAGYVALVHPPFRTRLDYLTGYLTGEPGPVEPRLAIWEGAWELFTHSPLLGTGLGSFARAAHLTQSVDNPKEAWFAHCDPLNMLCDAGIIGALLAAWWLGGLLWRGRGALFGEDRAARALSVGAVGGVVVVLIAAVGDFQTQFPVVALPFAMLLTIPAALAPDLRSADEPTSRPWLLPARGLAALCGVLFAGLTVLPLVEFGMRWAERSAGDPIGATVAERRLARARQTIGAVAQATSPEEAEALLGLAEVDLREAVGRDPLLDEAHYFLGLTYASLKRDREDVLRALGRARRVSRGHAGVNLRIGHLYLMLGVLDDAPDAPPGEGALAALREGGALEPQVFTAAWRIADGAALGPDARQRLTPDRAHAQISLGRYMQQQGLPRRAVEAFQRAVEVEPWSPQARLELADALATEAPDEAQRHYREALRLDPESEGVRRRADAGLERLGAQR